MRSLGIVRLVAALIGVAVFWRLQPDLFGQLIRLAIAFDAEPSDPSSHPMFASGAAILLIGIALRFGLPLILKGALLLPYAAMALSRAAGRRRGATFDPARDLSADAKLSGAQEGAAIDQAIAAALAARNSPQPAQSRDAPHGFADSGHAAHALAPAPIHRFGRRDAA